MEKIVDLGIDTYVTAEPLMQFDLDKMIEYIKRCKPLQVNIGRNTNRKVQLPEPTANEAKVLVMELEKFTTVEIKKMQEYGLSENHNQGRKTNYQKW